MGVMRILDRTGDSTLVWDAEVDETVRRAEARFDELLAARHLAFARAPGSVGADTEQIRRFDPAADEIIFVRPIVGG